MKRVNQSRFKIFGITFLVVALLPLRALAECDFSTIEKLSDGRYAYQKECHQKVGKIVQDLKDREDQVAAKDVQIKNLGVDLTVQEKRTQLWMDTSFKLEDRVNQMDSMRSTNQWLFFGLGILTTGFAVWGAGQLR